MLTDKEKKEIVELYKNDKNVSEISRITKKSRNTINSVLEDSDVNLDIKPKIKSDNGNEYFIDKFNRLDITDDTTFLESLKKFGINEFTNFKMHYKFDLIKRLYNINPIELMHNYLNETIIYGLKLDIQGKLKDFISGGSQTDELRKLWMEELIEASKPAEETENELEPEKEPEPDTLNDMILMMLTHGNIEDFERLRKLRDKTPLRKEIIDIPKDKTEPKKIELKFNDNDLEPEPYKLPPKKIKKKNDVNEKKIK